MTLPALFSRGGAGRRRTAAAAQDRHDRPDGDTAAPTDGTPAGQEPAGVGASRAAAVAKAVSGWRPALQQLGGESTLADITLLGEAVIDLTAAHPSGIAQLYAGRTTRLSNLVREGSAQLAARRSARTVRAVADELAQRYGVAPTFLAIGVATWTALPEPLEPDVDEAGDVALEVSADPGAALADRPAAGAPAEPDGAKPVAARVRTVHAPVLLRPVRLTAHPGTEGDVDLGLEPGVEINPVLVRALRAAGVRLDLTALTGTTDRDHGFTPRAALAALADVGRENLPGFEMSERIVVGPFVHPGQVLVDDLTAMRPHLAASDVVAALAGDEGARAALHGELPSKVLGDRAPEAERGAGDLDVDQQHAVDAVATGAHVFLDAPPGSDVPGTLAAVVADAAACGRRVLYVPGTRRTGRALLGRLEELGLGDIVLDLSTDGSWRTRAAAQLRAGLSPAAVQVDDDAVRALRAELTDVHARLAGYVAGLHQQHQPWGVSAYDALQALARLTSARPGPRTRVRLDPEALRRLADGGLAEAREHLARAAGLGAFTLRPKDTPWYGADLTEPAAASAALERTQRLGELSLPALAAQIARVTEQTGLETATTLAAWTEQLEMLDGIAEALDVFLPQVFERSAADMVVATATRAWRREHGVTMKGSVRRRLRKQARDLVRPGRPVADVHAELLRVQEKREIWRRYEPHGGWPRLPDGLAEIRATEREVRADVQALQAVVGAGAGKEDLTTLPLETLTERMRELGLDAPALRILPERTALLRDLRAGGLGALIDDLTERAVPAALVAAELDLAWWSSVLEQILRTDPALAGYDGPALAALVGRFRELDAAQVAGLAGPVRRAVAAQLATAVRDRRDEAAVLFDALGRGGGHLRETYAAHPDLTGAIRPVWLVAPVLVPQLLPEGRVVDLLILDGAQHMPVEQAVAMLARARQVVLVGDSRRGGDGLVPTLAPLLPAVTLPTGRAARDEGIAAFLAQHGYGDVIRSVPAPPSSTHMRLDRVDGFGMPAPGSDAIESVQAEVDRVVDLVIDHALTAPESSLAVVALNARHAERVREAVSAAVAGSPAVAGFFQGERPEPFTVVEADAAAGLARDVVVLSVGYGKTPHGRVLHRFGLLDGPDGLACLVDALDAVRHQLVIVSCIGPGEIDRDRLRQPGPRLLADLLDQAAVGTPSGETPTSAPEESPDQLLVDLAERLWRLGLIVVPRYGLEGGVRIPLAIGHPDLPGELLLAVLTDDAEYVAEPSLRRRDRHWVQRLTDRGWRVHMAFSTAVFMDPQAEAERILAQVVEVVEERRASHRAVLEAAQAPAGAGVASSEAGDGAPAQPVDASAPSAEAGSPAAPAPARPRGPRPPVVAGLPLAAYGDDQLDDLVTWLSSDGAERDDAELVELLRGELALTRRGDQVDAVLGHAVRRRSR
ncbi:hypothetical protein FE374_03150 [Georgenia yuyongxinii]|uniref:Restriction endonuclease type II-like domain-containing protein n=1 Tax=Georgenia yuyongxinii TaxID=2589797 RepID=A0A5B8BZB4_9MICO|nr:hypothetical protein [Georgenia yuyongxinii]QDC23759.1 hypothetical protein FE374_03150 [Georgenia yuyongxinii]